MIICNFVHCSEFVQYVGNESNLECSCQSNDQRQQDKYYNSKMPYSEFIKKNLLLPIMIKAKEAYADKNEYQVFRCRT